jgi:hypothetical protein
MEHNLYFHLHKLYFHNSIKEINFIQISGLWISFWSDQLMVAFLFSQSAPHLCGAVVDDFALTWSVS